MVKFFRFPFALTGDRTPVPDESQPSGAVSYNQGFGPDYERVPGTDPLAKRVPRNETNQYLFDITDNIRDYQLWGSPEWFPASVNGGSPVAYGVGAQVRYDAGAGVQLWQSIAANNTATPGSDDTKWVLAEPFNFTSAVASQAEVQAGAVNNKIVTPLGLTYRTATTARTGLAALATNAEVAAGTDMAKIVTPAGLASLTATESLSGLVALATTAEVQAGANSAKAVTPAGLSARTATAARTGLAALASQAEVIAGTDTAKIVTPATLQGKTATPARQGIVQMATGAEVLAGALDNKAVSPASLRANIYTGGARDELEFPVGHILLSNIRGPSVPVVRNGVFDVFLSTVPQAYTLGELSSGVKLNGTWAVRGIIGYQSSEIGDDCGIMQRIA